ncbi:MAG: cysteine desulfurase, partial [Betaproteobacteria bacterium]|nr:cysteine desulfurase [Betaproteobacteria bacterium]
SHVLLAMGIAPEIAQTAVRASFGAETTAEEVRRFTAAALAVREKMAGLSSVRG